MTAVIVQLRHRPRTSMSTAQEADARMGMRWFNGLSPLERRYWLDLAGSAVPADAWRAFQSGYPPP